MTRSLLVLSVFFVMFSTSCKKDSSPAPTPAYTCTTCIQTPEALVANDNSSKGIYKGVVIGSTGTIKFNIANNGSDITALLELDGISGTLSSSVAWVNGQTYVAPFAGTFNGSAASVTFSVSATGTNPTVVTSNIPGHTTAEFRILKENSSSLLEGFIGTYSTTAPETGIFNIMVSRNAGLWGGISREDGTTTSNNQNGTISNNSLYQGTPQALGTINGDVLSGSFPDGNNNTVTINARRVL